VEEGPGGRHEGPAGEARVLVQDGGVLEPDEDVEAEPPALRRRARLEAEGERLRVRGGDVEEADRRPRDGEAVAARALVEGRVEREGRPHVHRDRLAAAVERAD